MVIHISESGDTQMLKATEYTHGRMEIGTKVNGSLASNTVKEQISSQTAMSIPANITKENLKERGNTRGLMAAFT